MTDKQQPKPETNDDRQPGQVDGRVALLLHSITHKDKPFEQSATK